jgi:hypothetical protein
MPARTVVPPPPPAPSTLSTLSIAPAAAALLKIAAHPNGPDTPSPSTTQRFRPSLASGGAAAAIAAAVAAAKARQVEEEKQHRENTPGEEPAVAPIKSTPLVVSAPPVSRVVPPPQPSASLKRGDNGSSVFLTDDPLVVKRPATAVMTQRMKSTSDATAAVATPPPAPPTRLPGTRAIPISVSRASFNGNGTETVEPTSSVPAFNEIRRPSDNLPMRRPPSDLYAKGKRRGSSAIFAEKEKKSFPWAIVGFVLVVALAVTALIMFAWSAPKMANTPALQPDKLTFTWKAGTPKPQEQILRLKGGQSSASFSASSSDEEWLTVTPVSDEPTNRSWQVNVDPEKVGPTGPNGASGWIDVVSTEGFKTQEEVILKVTSADPGSGRAKKSPAAALVPPSAPAVVPAATLTGAKAPAPKPVVKKPAPDGIDINNN